MYYSPHTHLALAKARHEDMLREAERERLARRFRDERPSVLARFRSFVSSRRTSAKGQPAPAAG
ncbi:MAG: hypothetical protein ABI649_09210 [Gaiellaceae bacterium]